MSGLDPADARRLRASLALLSSDKDGERLAALNAVGRLLEKGGRSFADLSPVDAGPKRPATLSRTERVSPPRLLREHQRESWLLLVSGYVWSEWERGFLGDLRQLDAPISERQRNKLRQLRQKADEWREARL